MAVDPKDSGMTPVYSLSAPPLIAPSAQDVKGQLEFFFGKPAQPEKLVDFTDHHAATGHFPDAFVGKNTFLRDTLSNLILKSPQTWQTSVALPYVPVDNVTVQWDEMHFDVRLLHRVPYEGSSRMQTSHRKKHRDRIVRRGIALIVESDFYRTEAGRKYFADTIKSIQYCVQETANFDVLYAYLSCHNYDWHYDVTKSLLPQHYLLGQMKREIEPFALVQKLGGRGFDIAIEKAKSRMARYGVTPNIMVVPPEMQLFVTMVPPEKVVYNEAGQNGVTRFESFNGSQAVPVGNMRGLNCYVSMPFEDNEAGRPNQLLRRQTQIGEFYVMSPPAVLGRAALPSSYMDILIYDEREDRLKAITFRNAVCHAMPWHIATKTKNAEPFGIKANAKSEASNIAASIAKLFEGGKTVTKTPDGLTGDVSDAAKMTETVKKFFGAFVEKEKENWRVLVDLAELGVYVPVQIVLTRPFIEHHMFSAIIAVAGTDTGATLFGPSDMQIASNVAVKVIEGHYTLHSKAVITRPQNVFVMNDIQCDGYVAGCDTTFFGDIYASYTKPNGKSTIDWDLEGEDAAECVRNDIRERLDFEHETDNRYPSLLCFAAPLHDNVDEVDRGTAHWRQDGAFSLANGHTPWDVGMDVGSRLFPGGADVFKAYSEAFGLTAITQGIDPASMHAHKYIRNGSTNNQIVLQGPYRSYSPFTESHFDLVPGQGHFGPDALPGDARWRRGEPIDAQSARSALVGVEALQESAKAMHRVNPRA